MALLDQRHLFTRNNARPTELFGVCPVCGSPLSKTYDGEVGQYYNVVCPEGHDRRMIYDREECKWKRDIEKQVAGVP